jgi:hypothetical protein
VTIGSVIVVSQRKGGTRPGPGYEIVPIDRRNRVLGNRHYLKNIHDAKARQAVIKANMRDLELDEAVNGPMTDQLKHIAQRVVDGQRIALECWCAPDPCHGDNYVRKIRLFAGLEP